MSSVWKIRAAMAAVIIALAGGVVYYNHAQSEVTNFTPEFEEGQEAPEASEASEERGIKIPGYSVIPVTAGTTEVAVDLTNPEENEVYFQITFLLTDTGEQIYQSKLLSPGQHLYEISLDRALEAGEYNLTIQYDTFSMDEEYTPRNGATVNCILRAQ
ncbi:MAG: hypothetical protein Q4C82_02200 [Eubacteriales bacterium]|nr:hypothetical protein [Eubacteriales bacterium]